MCRCYVTRTSLKCVSPGLSYGKVDPGANGKGPTWAPDDDTRVCFQYSAIDLAPKGSPAYKSDDELYAQLVADLKEYGAQEVKVGFLGSSSKVFHLTKNLHPVVSLCLRVGLMSEDLLHLKAIQ